MNQVAENLARVKERIANAAQRSSRQPSSVNLVVVTKGISVSQIEIAIAEGETEIGENRVQEAQHKYNSIGISIDKALNASAQKPVPKWHLIGHLQRNKVKTALEIFSLIHSVDSLRLFKEISNRSKDFSKNTKVLLQVNTTGETSKYGLDTDEVVGFIEQSLLYPNVHIIGLMTIGMFSPSPEDNRTAFKLLSELSEEVNKQEFPGVNMQYLSMGMTNDFEIAIEEGANIVRIGSAIFGNDV